MTRHRVGIAGLWHETNTYGPHPADLAAFEAFELLTGTAIVEHHAATRSVIGGFLGHTDFDLVPAFSAGAWPSGPAPAATLAVLLDGLTGALAAAGPLDGLLLNLHGAMVAEGCPDVEAEALRRIRALVGDIPIAAVLDLHANPSPEFAGLCDIALSYDTYPHVDMWERGKEAAQLLALALDGRPLVTVVAKAPLLTCPLAQATDAEPMRGLQARATARARAAGLLRAGVTAGFAYSDVARAGMSVLVVADAGLAAAARAVAGRCVEDIEAHADAFTVERPGAGNAVALAIEAARAPDRRPVVLADLADNIGGGSAGDGTALLAELLAQGAENAVVVIADAEAVAAAAQAGPGGRVRRAVGGRSDRLHGEPVPVDATVVSVSDGRYTTQGTWMTGQSFDMGPSAVLAVDGVRLVVTTRPTPPFHREQVTSQGIDPAEAGIIVAKGAVAWRAAYPDARTVIEVATPGACAVDLTLLPRTATPLRVV
ncbi:M81 family metallopeptidase [Nonomuraea sp. NPDC050547]|uniref:M81 family metallopeptidase n=1 Tax=Nonomuraea sp. NPDC050547 TaxID=3364368 RepID=UPI00378D301F